MSSRLPINLPGFSFFGLQGLVRQTATAITRLRRKVEIENRRLNSIDAPGVEEKLDSGPPVKMSSALMQTDKTTSDTSVQADDSLKEERSREEKVDLRSTQVQIVSDVDKSQLSKVDELKKSIKEIQQQQTVIIPFGMVVDDEKIQRALKMQQADGLLRKWFDFNLCQFVFATDNATTAGKALGKLSSIINSQKMNKKVMFVVVLFTDRDFYLDEPNPLKERLIGAEGVAQTKLLKSFNEMAPSVVKIVVSISGRYFAKDDGGTTIQKGDINFLSSAGLPSCTTVKKNRLQASEGQIAGCLKDAIEKVRTNENNRLTGAFPLSPSNLFSNIEGRIRKMKDLRFLETYDLSLRRKTVGPTGKNKRMFLFRQRSQGSIVVADDESTTFLKPTTK